MARHKFLDSNSHQPQQQGLWSGMMGFGVQHHWKATPDLPNESAKRYSSRKAERRKRPELIELKIFHLVTYCLISNDSDSKPLRELAVLWEPKAGLLKGKVTTD